MNKTFYVKYIGIIDGDMGILTRKVTAPTQHTKFSSVYITKPIMDAKVKSHKSLITSKREDSKPKDIVFKNKKLTLFNSLASPTFFEENKKLPATLNKAKERKKPMAISKQKLIRVLTTVPTLEKYTGIPNPAKYQSKVINDVMPVQRLIVTRNEKDSNKRRNHKSSFNIQYPLTRSGVTGTKFTCSRERLSKPMKTHGPYKKVFSLRITKRMFDMNYCNQKDSSSLGNVLSIKNASYFSGRKIKYYSIAHRSKKRRVVVHLDRDTNVNL